MFDAFKRWIRNAFASQKPAAPAAQTPVALRRVAEQRYNRIVIPLHSGLGDPPPGHWKQCAASTVHRFKAELTCPFGHGMTLKSHTVAANGFVSPSVVCHKGSCRFHEFVTLAGWNQGAVR
jgi:hypothetical protein